MLYRISVREAAFRSQMDIKCCDCEAIENLVLSQTTEVSDTASFFKLK